MSNDDIELYKIKIKELEDENTKMQTKIKEIIDSKRELTEYQTKRNKVMVANEKLLDQLADKKDLKILSEISKKFEILNKDVQNLEGHVQEIRNMDKLNVIIIKKNTELSKKREELSKKLRNIQKQLLHQLKFLSVMNEDRLWNIKEIPSLSSNWIVKLKPEMLSHLLTKIVQILDILHLYYVVPKIVNKYTNECGVVVGLQDTEGNQYPFYEDNYRLYKSNKLEPTINILVNMVDYLNANTNPTISKQKNDDITLLSNLNSLLTYSYVQ